MICSNKYGFSVYGLNKSVQHCGPDGSLGGLRTVGVVQFTDSKSKELTGQSIDVSDRMGCSNWNAKGPILHPVKAPINKNLRWCEKNLQPNMIEINSSQQFVDSLLYAGDKLVIVDFFSPGCGGCKTLHPKICQLAESNPNATFLTVNNEEMRKMSSALGVNVIPFFRFYRGAQGKLCSFSCTIATIKKFKVFLEKYSVEEYGIGPAKGLEDHELLALASIGEISRKFDDEKKEHMSSDSLPKFEEVKVDSKEGSASTVVLA